MKILYTTLLDDEGKALDNRTIELSRFAWIARLQLWLLRFRYGHSRREHRDWIKTYYTMTITTETLKRGLAALDVHPKEELPDARMKEVIAFVLEEHFELEYECPTCTKDLPETTHCFYCGEFLDGVEETPLGPSRKYANYAKVDGERLLDRLIRFFGVDEVKRGKTVVSFRDTHLGVLFKTNLMKYSLKVEFPYRAERIAHHKKLGITNYKTPRAGYPSRAHVRELSEINPVLLEALTSVKALRAQEKITAPELRNRLERAGLKRAIRNRRKKENE